MSHKAIVKSALSGDSLLLRGRPGPQGQPPKERVLYIADVNSPRMGSSTREDEPWAFEAREFMRALAVGKEISFSTSHSLTGSTDEVPRDIGTGEIGGLDLGTELLKNGWAKLKELGKRDPTEDDLKRRELEAEAKAAGKGVWNPHGPKSRVVTHNMPVDSQAFMQEWKGKQIDAIVEQVRDGSTLRVRLLLPEGDHQIVNLSLAGVRCARIASRPEDKSESWAEEARFFTESRLLQRFIRVILLSLPNPAATPLSQASDPSAPQTASIFIGTALHPAGNIAEHLVAIGLARVVDWHAGMLAAGGGMERLRAAEKTAKEKHAYLYANAHSQVNSGAVNGSSSKTANGDVRSFTGQVVRVWSADQISVLDKDSGKERRLYLSSTRGPKVNDPKRPGYWPSEAKEFLRKRLIGKTVHVHIDFLRPAEGNFSERECATIRYGGNNNNVAEQLIEKGLATCVRHRRDDEDRSSDYDKLMAAEQAAASESRGVHSGQEPAMPRISDASESAAKANQFLNGFKRQGRIPAVVDYVASGSRFRILLPKEHQTLTLVLSGIRAPRAPRMNPGSSKATDSGEPCGAEAMDFSTKRYMQRDVEVEFDSVDKQGAFIGALYVNKTENVAISLVREGLASVHTYSAEGLPWSKQLFDVEEEAKQEHRNLWKDYSGEEEKAASEEIVDASKPLDSKYVDVIVSDVRNNGFSVQILNTEGIATLEKLMHDFSQHHRSAASAPGFVPKNGELISARFSDGSWYRAKVRRSSPAKKEAEVTFIDYGNQDTVAFKNIRPLDVKFRSLPGQAHDARLSFVKLPAPDSEYFEDAMNKFRNLVEGRKLVANEDSREGSLQHLRLMDPSDPAAADDPLACINADLLREGLATIDRKGCRYVSAYPTVFKKLQDAINGAKRDRLGMFEFGDIEEDDD